MLARINQRIKRTGAYQRYKHSAAYVTLKEWQKDLRRKFHLSKYRGSDYRCPVCGTGLAAFKPGANSYAKMVRAFDYVHPLSAIETFNIEAYSCPSCDASDRDRLCALYLDRVLRAREQGRRCHVIEFAPGFGLPRKLKGYPFVDYRSADLFRPNVDDRVDVSDMRAYADGSADVVLCSHVLEHVPDDRRAMRELHRILRADGFAVVMVPLVHGVDETHEDAALATPALRWKYYGSDDHVRQYGKRDFIDRLAAAGFTVEQLGIDFFGSEAFRRAGIAADSILYVARKAKVAASGAAAS
jgi:SAM-dependent methyltransferase